MNTRNHWKRCAGLLVLGWMAVQGVLLADSEDTIKKSFKVEAGGTLAVKLDRGAIEVTGGAADTVEVEVTRKASREEDLKRHQVTVEMANNQVTVEGKMEDGVSRSWWPGRQLQVRCVVKVPRKFAANLRTAGGPVTVKDLEGSLDAGTSGGPISLSKIVGTVKGRTSGGHITVNDIVGPVDVGTSGGSLDITSVKGDLKGHTSGGSVKVSKAEGESSVGTSGGSIKLEDMMGAVTASTSGGSITARFAAAPVADCSLKTSGGSVTLELPEKASVDLDASTSGGRATSDLPVEMTVKGEPRRGHLAGKINGGGPKMVLRSSGGGVHVAKR